MSYTVTNTRLLVEETEETEVLERAITNCTKKSRWFSQWFPNTQSKPCITSADAIFITNGINRECNRGRSRGNSHHVLHYYFNSDPKSPMLTSYISFEEQTALATWRKTWTEEKHFVSVPPYLFHVMGSDQSGRHPDSESGGNCGPHSQWGLLLRRGATPCSFPFHYYRIAEQTVTEGCGIPIPTLTSPYKICFLLVIYS